MLWRVRVCSLYTRFYNCFSKRDHYLFIYFEILCVKIIDINFDLNAFCFFLICALSEKIFIGKAKTVKPETVILLKAL
jgi:hypothetical protein